MGWFNKRNDVEQVRIDLRKLFNDHRLVFAEQPDGSNQGVGHSGGRLEMWISTDPQGRDMLIVRHTKAELNVEGL